MEIPITIGFKHVGPFYTFRVEKIFVEIILNHFKISTIIKKKTSTPDATLIFTFCNYDSLCYFDVMRSTIVNWRLILSKSA